MHVVVVFDAISFAMLTGLDYNNVTCYSTQRELVFTSLQKNLYIKMEQTKEDSLPWSVCDSVDRREHKVKKECLSWNIM